MNTTIEPAVSEYMSEQAKKRWKGKTEKQRKAHMSMMGKKSASARKPRGTRTA